MPAEEFRYVLMADMYGWTPPQVDEIPLALEPWIVPIQNAINEDRDNKQAAADARAKAKAELEQKLGKR